MSERRASTAKVNLVGAADFELCGLLVCPSSCRVRIDGRDERIEPRVMEVLLVLAQAKGRTVTRDQLIEACWEGRIVSDDALARVIAKVRQVGRLQDPPAFSVETLPKIGFRLLETPPVGGTPVSDVTYAVVSPREDAGPYATDSADHGGRRRLWVVGLLAVAFVALVGWRMLAGREIGPDLQVIEVATFQPLREDADLRALASRATDATLRSLMLVGVSAQRAAAERDAAAPPPVAALRLSASVDRADGNIILVNQVIDRASGVILWNWALQRPTEQEAGVEQQFATGTATVMGCVSRARTGYGKPVRLEVLALLFQNCGASILYEGDYRSIALQLAEAAPDMPQAHAFVALSNFESLGVAGSEVEAEAMIEAGSVAIDRALRLDPNSAHALAARSQLWRLRGDFVKVEQDIRAAAREMPGLPPVQIYMLNHLRDTGRFREAILHGERHLRSGDPMMSGMMHVLALLSAMSNDRDGAGQAIAAAENLYSPRQIAGLRLNFVLWWEGDVTQTRLNAAFAAAPEFASSQPCWNEFLARVRTAEGAAVAGLPATCRELPVDWRIRMLARQGDIDAAYALVAEELPLTRRFTGFLFYPEMRRFRQDARFLPLTEAWGLLAYWRETGNWPDFCEDPELPYDCRAAL